MAARDPGSRLGALAGPGDAPRRAAAKGIAFGDARNRWETRRCVPQCRAKKGDEIFAEIRRSLRALRSTVRMLHGVDEKTTQNHR